MGLFSSIQESLNPDIVDRFSNLYDNHYRGAKFLYDFAMKTPGSFGAAHHPYDSYEPFSRNIQYWKKRVLVDYEYEVKEIDKDFVQEDHKQEIIAAAQKFPRAYLYYCTKNGISASSLYTVDSGIGISMPGNTSFTSFSAAKKQKTSLSYGLSSTQSQAVYYDSHFESLIKKELDGFPKISNFRFPVPIQPPFARLLGKNIQSGSILDKYEAQMHGLSITSTSVSVSFKENKEVTILYPLIPWFEAREKLIDSLAKREKLWHSFEKRIILNPIAAQYYKSYFRSRYGTQDVPLSAYEELAKDPSPLNQFISKQEEHYLRLKKDCPYGTEQFEKTHPQVPHTEFKTYESEIQRLEVQSKYVKYPYHQTNLSKELISKLVGKTSWDFERFSIVCHAESYDGRSHVQTCDMMFASHQFLLDKALQGSMDPYMATRYPHCKDILDAKSLNSLTGSQLLGILTEVLIPMIDTYLSIFKPVHIILDETIEGLLERDSSKDASGTLLDSIYLQKRYPKNDLQVFTTSVFRIAHPDHVPYIFVDVIDSQERAQKKLSELADNYLISSIISVVNLIDEDKLKAIESDRKKEEDEKTMRKVQEIRRDYPYGFNRFCAKNGISEDQFVNRYASFLNSLDEIRQIQRTEDQRKREEARRQHENAIINMARSLVSTYPNAARENGYSASSTIDYGTAQTILSKESLWKEIETLYYNRFELFGVTKSVSGLPHKFFFDYYPTNKYTETDLSKEQLSSRSFIWGFKDGKDYYQTKAVEMVSEFINNSGLKQFASKLVLVCSPASSSISNEVRYRFFSEEVCNKTGITNGFHHIEVTGIATPKHLGGKGCVDFDAEESFFSGKYVLLFDDLVTSGGTISLTKRRLESAGAKVIGLISLGQTKSSW